MKIIRGTQGAMVICIENGHSDPSSNSKLDCLHFV